MCWIPWSRSKSKSRFDKLSARLCFPNSCECHVMGTKWEFWRKRVVGLIRFQCQVMVPDQCQDMVPTTPPANKDTMIRITINAVADVDKTGQVRFGGIPDEPRSAGNSGFLRRSGTGPDPGTGDAEKKEAHRLKGGSNDTVLGDYPSGNLLIFFCFATKAYSWKYF